MQKKRFWNIVLPVMILVIVLIFSFQHIARTEEPEKEGIPASSVYTGVALPDSLTFAGEVVPLHYFDIRESLERELLVNGYFHSQTIRLIKMAPRYFSVIEPILKEKELHDDFKYLAVAESNLDPTAISPAGAVGLWQFMKSTAREYGLEVTSEVDERYHVEKSTYAACDYLQSAYEKFGSWSLAAAAFNAGRSFIVKQAERQKYNNYFDMLLGEETERYLFRILALKLVLENPENYGFIIPEEEKYPIIPTTEIEINGPVEHFADFAFEQGTNYKILKMFNPWLRENYLTNSAGKTYRIRIPLANARRGRTNSNQE